MSNPASLIDRREPPPRPEEAHYERRARQLAFLRELAELGMAAARAAAERVEQADPETDQADVATLSLARATRAVTTIFAIENRIADGEQASQIRPGDPRRIILREALYPLVNQEPDPPRRAALRRRTDQAIDDALLTDLDDTLPLVRTATAIANSFGLRLDLAQVSDALLGIKPRSRTPPGPFDRDPFDDPSEDDLLTDEPDAFARAPPDRTAKPSR